MTKMVKPSGALISVKVLCLIIFDHFLPFLKISFNFLLFSTIFDNFLPFFIHLLQFSYNLSEHNDLKSRKVKKVVWERFEFHIKALNFAIIAVQVPWSGTQNSVSVTL